MPSKSRAARSVESESDGGDSGADDEGDEGEGEGAAPRLLATSGSNVLRPPPTGDADGKQAARAQKRFKTMKAVSRSLHGKRALARVGVATIATFEGVRRKGEWLHLRNPSRVVLQWRELYLFVSILTEVSLPPGREGPLQLFHSPPALTGQLRHHPAGSVAPLFRGASTYRRACSREREPNQIWTCRRC